VSKKIHVLSVNEVSCFLVLFFDPPPPYRSINVPRVTERRHGQQGVLQSGSIIHFIYLTHKQTSMFLFESVGMSM